MIFLDLRFHKRIQSAVNLGHRCFLPATHADRIRGVTRLAILGPIGCESGPRLSTTGTVDERGTDRQKVCQPQELHDKGPDAVVKTWPDLSADWLEIARFPGRGLLPRCPKLAAARNCGHSTTREIQRSQTEMVCGFFIARSSAYSAP
jgi:hypothetical protein